VKNAYTQEKNMNLNELLQNSTNALSTGGSITILSIIVALSVTLACGLFIAYIYRTQYQGVLYHQSHATSIVLISLVTTMVIMVISGNIVLSLGMVGALSIVRFRGAIKDPLDIVYLFWAVGIGIANGVAYFSVSIISSLFIGLVLIYLKRSVIKIDSKLLVINCISSNVNEIISVVESLPGKSTLRSRSDDNDESELVFEFLSSGHDVSMEKLNDQNGVIKLRTLNYSANN
tara:strand:- start:3965 stop:4660 length:696 start_codon:yes stop_codon:yes gene_type:complete